jgi:1-deoxy-D-xylulose-5-phosphate synthase
MDESMLDRILEKHTALLTVEEGTVINGFGASLARIVEARREQQPAVRVDVMGVPDRIFEHATRAEQLAEAGLDAAGIAERARALAVAAVVPAARTA